MELKKLELPGTDPSKEIIVLYHGSSKFEVNPTFGLGDDKHDYGRGFYMSPSKELAKEWAVGNSTDGQGWVHTFELKTSGLEILNFEAIKKQRALEWITELLRHREPEKDDIPFYDEYRDFLLMMFKRDSAKYDVVCGWRADDSYFRIATYLLNDGLAILLLEQALRLGELGIQYCCRSRASFDALTHIGQPESVPFEKYRRLYLERDRRARAAFEELRRSPSNQLRKGNIFMRDLYLGSR